MTDKQLEKWRKEYFKLTGEIAGNSAKFSGFLLAKENMTPIKIRTYDLHHYAPVRDIAAQLRELGIKYEITGIVNGR
jgi:hypothetical protein